MSESSNIDQFVEQMNFISTMVKMLPQTTIQPAANRAFAKHGRMFTRSISESIRSRSDNRDVLHRRTGALARAFNSTVVDENGKTTLLIWVDSTVNKYWKIQEFGGVIKAGAGKMLAIPAAAAMTPAGVPKYKSPREIPDLFIIKGHSRSKPGAITPMLGRIEGNKIVIYFYLKKSVEVPARLGLRDKWNDSLPLAVPMIKQELQIEFEKYFKNNK